jgi:hypothetical protein
MKGFTPFNIHKHSFWYFYTFSVRCWAIQKQLLGLNTSFHWEHLRNKKRGDVGDQ